MRGHFNCRSIIIEGQDSLGKSLQTHNVVEHLKSVGFKVERIKSPYDDGLTFKLIYWMLENGWARKVPNIFQFIHFFNKLVFQWFVLPKLLDENDFIVFDRWSISMWAYGVPDGANATLTRWMLSMIAEPDATVVLDGERFKRDRADDSYESDTAYQRVVRGMYLNWVCSHDPERVGLVNANQEVYKVTADIVEMLEDMFVIPMSYREEETP